VNLEALSLSEVRRRLRNGGLALRVGPFSFRLISALPGVAEGLWCLYRGYPLIDDGAFVDYTVTLSSGGGWRRWFRRQAVFRFDGIEPFIPLPQVQAFALLEWSMNWCVSAHANQFLLLHAAVLERDGCAAILPAPPGSGKSTLCAALIHRGWRLLSDELALIALDGAAITAFGRPVSLKNQSIELIQRFAPDAVFSDVTHDTGKGSVAHMMVPADQIARLADTARPRWVVFPKYTAGAAPLLSRRSRANSMLELGRNSFNYMVLGLEGFTALSRVIDSSDCYDFSYSQLDDAVAVFDKLAQEG
jgi:HprK-related kinase A